MSEHMMGLQPDPNSIPTKRISIIDTNEIEKMADAIQIEKFNAVTKQLTDMGYTHVPPFKLDAGYDSFWKNKEVEIRDFVAEALMDFVGQQVTDKVIAAMATAIRTKLNTFGFGWQNAWPNEWPNSQYPLIDKTEWASAVEQFKERKSFCAYAEMGAAIPHVGIVTQTSDPELMEALGKAIDNGSFVIDKDGQIIEVSDPKTNLQNMRITSHKLKADGSEEMTLEFTVPPADPDEPIIVDTKEKP